MMNADTAISIDDEDKPDVQASIAAASAAAASLLVVPPKVSSIAEALAADTNYDNVTYRKVQGGLKLTITSFTFQASSAANNNSNQVEEIPWTSIVKHQVSPAKHTKALLKIVFADGRSSTYQFAVRIELERIRTDISYRIQHSKASNAQNKTTTLFAASSQQNGAIPQSPVVSSKKRSYSSLSSPPPFMSSPSRGVLPGKTSSVSFGELDSTEVAVTRSSLLAANPSLRAQHQYLVTETETVDEDDFWDTHQDLLEEEYARISGMTRAGTSSLLQSHLQLMTGRVTLGVEEMRQIFILYPAVHKAYEEKVPLELSDEQFWRKYLESEYFHRDRGRLGAASGNSVSDAAAKKNKNGKTVEEQEARAAAMSSDDIFSRYDQKLKERNGDDQNVGAKGKQWGTNLAVGQFDLAATFETERGKLLSGPKDNHPPSENDDGKGARVIQKYNRHWAMVLHPEEAKAGCNLMEVSRRSVDEVLPNDSDAKAGGGEDEEMYRLVDFANAPQGEANHALGKGLQDSDEFSELTLKNIESYYSSHRDMGSNANERPDEQTMRKRAFFAKSIVAKANGLARDLTDDASSKADTFPPSDLGRELLMALTKKMAQDSQTDADALQVVNSLPEEFKKRLHSYFRRSSELLRHFFALRRLAETQGSRPSHNQKLKKIVQGMENVYREMEGMRKELGQTQSGELMQVMQKMCLQIMDQLDCAFKLHREGTGSGGGGGFVTIEEF